MGRAILDISFVPYIHTRKRGTHSTRLSLDTSPSRVRNDGYPVLICNLHNHDDVLRALGIDHNRVEESFPQVTTSVYLALWSFRSARTWIWILDAEPMYLEVSFIRTHAVCIPSKDLPELNDCFLVVFLRAIRRC
jgi:hypothetical protein